MIEAAIREQEALPPVVADWHEQLQAAERVATLIDRHLDYEDGREWTPHPLSPGTLCESQKVALVTDLLAVAPR